PLFFFEVLLSRSHQARLRTTSRTPVIRTESKTALDTSYQTRDRARYFRCSGAKLGRKWDSFLFEILQSIHSLMMPRVCGCISRRHSPPWSSMNSNLVTSNRLAIILIHNRDNIAFSDIFRQIQVVH